MAYVPGVTRERRKGADSLNKTLKWFGVCSWILMFIALIIIEKARPQAERFLDRNLDIQLQSTWDLELLRYLFYMMVIGLCVSVVGFAINAQRHRRRTDEYLISVIFLGIVSIFTIVYYIFSV